MKPDNIDIENFIEALIMQISVDSRDDEKNHQLEFNHETVSDLSWTLNGIKCTVCCPWFIPLQQGNQ